MVAALSGGVDSSVMAALLHRAIGDRLHPIFVDNGLLRKNEAAEVISAFHDQLGIRLHRVNAVDRFLDRLQGVTDPELKRKIIGEEFIRVFEQESHQFPNVRFLAQGTLYPDVIESVSFRGRALGNNKKSSQCRWPSGKNALGIDRTAQRII